AVSRTADGLCPADGAEISRTLNGREPGPEMPRVTPRQAPTAVFKLRSRPCAACGVPIASMVSPMNGPFRPPTNERSTDALDPGGLSAFISATNRRHRGSFDESV